MEIQVATIEIEGKIMSAGFHSNVDVDEARKELEEAQKHTTKSMRNMRHKHTHELPLDTENPEVRRIQ